MENKNLDNYRDSLIELGEIMFSLLYEGKELTDEEINIIKNATNNQKLLAMEMFAYEKLKGINYTNYCHNIIRIKRRRQNKKK